MSYYILVILSFMFALLEELVHIPHGVWVSGSLFFIVFFWGFFKYLGSRSTPSRHD